MEKLIAPCGIDCTACDARKATIADDNELRKATAKAWSVEFTSPGITWEMINCTGCREDGPKFSHCTLCEIKKCSMAKGYDTCGECNELTTCLIIAPVINNVPGAKSNLLGHV